MKKKNTFHDYESVCCVEKVMMINDDKFAYAHALIDRQEQISSKSKILPKYCTEMHACST